MCLTGFRVSGLGFRVGLTKSYYNSDHPSIVVTVTVPGNDVCRGKSRINSGALSFRGFIESELGLSSERAGQLLVEYGLEARETPASAFIAAEPSEEATPADTFAEEAPETPALEFDIPQSSAILPARQLS